MMVMPQTMPGVQPDYTGMPRWQRSRSQAVESFPVLKMTLRGTQPKFGVGFLKPVEVEISYGEGYWAATSPDVDTTGAGDTPREAAADFIDALVERHRWLGSRPQLGPALQEELSTLSARLRSL